MSSSRSNVISLAKRRSPKDESPTRLGVIPADAPEEAGVGPRPEFVARAELTLAMPDHLGLRRVPLRPDPLQGITAALSSVNQEDGERADVVLDLVPVTAEQLNRRRKQLLRSGRRGRGAEPILPGMPHGGRGSLDLGGVMAQVAREVKQSGSSAGGRGGAGVSSEGLSVRADMTAVLGKYMPHEPKEPVFAFQLLVRASSRVEGRERMLLDEIITALEVWSGDNQWKEVGLNLLVHRVGADSVLYRHQFDRRFATGEFSPRGRRRWVNGSEIAGLLKPPTVHNAHAKLPDASVPLPPGDLVEYTGQRDLLPLGFATGADGREFLVGVPLRWVLFGLFLGKSGYGKTEMSLIQAIALAHSGQGVMFLDPHGDGWGKAKRFLSHEGLYERLWEIDLSITDPEAMVASWNPLSMQGRRAKDIPKVVGAIVDSFSSALNWGDSSGRAKTILTRSVQSLAYLSYRFAEAGHPELAPTVFQIQTILMDEDWRKLVVSYLPPRLQAFWRNSFPKYPGEAAPVVTNIIERLDSSDALKAFLGSPESTYDIRRAMDEGKIVFICPEGSSDTDRIISCLLIYDLFRAGLSRRNIHPSQRRAFWTFIDELTAVDGASKGHLAAITEQLRKYMVKLLAMTQMMQRLTPTTRAGLLQNLSILSTTAADVEEAALVTKRWGGAVDPNTVVKLQPYHYVMSVNRGSGMSDPFRVRGASVEEAYALYDNPDGAGRLQEALNTNLKRRPVGQILAELETLDERIFDGVNQYLIPVRVSARVAAAGDIESEPTDRPRRQPPGRTGGAPGSAIATAAVDPEQAQYDRPDDADEAWSTDLG
ncbi:ATP/GTP-binding protein [Kitasatospora sp. NPDC085879]|uniref:ATP/GTP-binding protein n=1 Tax=Kitasatospora sp. NPDC085879 TaxID=3154769 RepID=UPI003440EE6A